MCRRYLTLAVLAIVACQSLSAAEFPGRVGRSDGRLVTHRYALLLDAGETIELSTRIVQPSKLPANARVRVSVSSGEITHLSKVLHALDGDMFTVFRAPDAGEYAIALKPEESELDLFEGNRWREAGHVDELMAAPRSVKWR